MVIPSVEPIDIEVFFTDLGVLAVTKVAQAFSILIDHLGHFAPGTLLVNFDSGEPGLFLGPLLVLALLLHIAGHAHLFAHEVRIDLGLLHEVLKSALLEILLFLLFLLLLQFLFHLLLFAFKVGQLPVPFLPKGEHLAGELLDPECGLLLQPVRLEHAFAHFFLTGLGQRLGLPLRVLVVLRNAAVAFWDVPSGQLLPHLAQLSGLLLLPLLERLLLLLFLQVVVTQNEVVELLLVLSHWLAGIKGQRQHVAAVLPHKQVLFQLVLLVGQGLVLRGLGRSRNELLKRLKLVREDRQLVSPDSVCRDLSKQGFRVQSNHFHNLVGAFLVLSSVIAVLAQVLQQIVPVWQFPVGLNKG